MATTKITDLTAYTDPVSTDVLPIVDVASDVTKKVSIADVMENAGSGTAAAPGISFDGDPNTGIYRPGADSIAITTGGTARFTATTTALTAAIPVDVLLGSASTPSYTFTGDTNTGIYSPGADQVAVATNGAGRLFVDSTGNVGLNTATPSSLLTLFRTTVNDTLEPSLTFGNNIFATHNPGGVKSANAGLALQLQSGSTGTFQNRSRIELNGGSSGNAIFSFSTDNGSTYTERLRITSAGLVGIGTSAPAENLHIKGAGATILRLENGNGVSHVNIRQNQTGNYLEISPSSASLQSIVINRPNGNEALRVDSSGRVGIGTTSPNLPLHISAGSAGSVDPFIRLENPSTTAGTGANILFTTGGLQTQAAIQGANTSDNNNGYLAFQVRGGNVLSERARIDSSGRLLVGTSSSSDSTAMVLAGQNGGGVSNPATLWMKRTTNASSITTGGGLGSIRFGSLDSGHGATISAFADGTWSSTSDCPAALAFSTTADGASSPTERMRINSAGLIGFGCTPTGSETTAGVQVGGAAGWLIAKRTDEPCVFLNRNNTDGAIINFYRSDSLVGTVSVTTTATAYNTSSDYRLKENVAPVTDGINRLQQLKPSRFNFIADPDTVVDGFIAHEVQDVVPEAITGEKDAVDDEGNPVYQGIDQSKLVPLLTAALQEAIGRIETLEAEVAALKTQ